jgi:hypothetical protein
MPLAADRDMQWLYKIVRLVARRSSIGGIGPDQHGPYALMPRCSVPHSPSVAAPHFRPPPRALRTKPPVRVRLRIRALRESHRGSQGRDAKPLQPIQRPTAILGSVQICWWQSRQGRSSSA